MTSLYRTTRIGSGNAASPYRASGMDDHAYVTLLIGEVRPAVLLVCANDDITGAGVTKMVTGVGMDGLRTAMRSSTPTAPQASQLRAWALSNGLEEPPSTGTWADRIDALVLQANPLHDLDATFLRESESDVGPRDE